MLGHGCASGDEPWPGPPLVGLRAYGPGMRMIGGAVAGAAVLLALTGCGSAAPQQTYTPTVTVVPSSSPALSGTASSRAPTASAGPSDEASDGPGPSSTPVADPGRPKGQCPDDDLGVNIRTAPGGGGAGSEYYQVLFTNTGGSTCELRGAPGVSVVGGGDGSQIGPAADRAQDGVKTLQIAVGATVVADLKVVNIGDSGGPLQGCTVRHGDGYRVYAPHSTRAVFVQDAKAVACTNTGFMTVGVVTPLS